MKRRDFLRTVGAGAAGICGGLSGWFPGFAQTLAEEKQRKRQCVLLWMSGGPSQMDTFDMKPGHANGGEFKEISTSVPGLKFSEHLPKLAKHAEHMSLIRGLSTKEGDHGRGTYLMRTGQSQNGPIRYPAIGSSLSKQLGNRDGDLPNYVSITPAVGFNPAAFSPGFLGPQYAAATVGTLNAPTPQPQNNANDDQGFAELGVDFLRRQAGVSEQQGKSRLDLWNSLQTGFLKGRSASSATAQDTIYRRAVRVMNGRAIEAFNLSDEPTEVREAYGRGRFGQGCLMARRLIERGVPFVEVSLGIESGGVGWDTHANNFASVRSLSEQLDAGWGALMTELSDRGLLETTTLLWMGEFGRTPTINPNGGRDHFPNAWSAVLAGGGIQGGSIHGKTSEDGLEVADGKVNETQVLATLCKALGVDPSLENITRIGRPVKIAEGEPIEEILS
jgi:hypothetical protein